MKIKGCLFALGLLFSFSSIASYEECQINNGSVGFCGSWAQKEKYPVRQSDGTYLDCTITNGSVGFCGSWSQEKAFPVRQSDGTYESCDINNGSVGFCGSWYNGTAVVEK